MLQWLHDVNNCVHIDIGIDWCWFMFDSMVFHTWLFNFFRMWLLSRDETHHGLAYTSGWPRGYKGPTTCIHTLTIPIDKYIRVVVMDLDLRKSYNLCNAYNDFFQIKGCSLSCCYHTLMISHLNCGRLRILLFEQNAIIYHVTSFHNRICTDFSFELAKCMCLCTSANRIVCWVEIGHNS